MVCKNLLLLDIFDKIISVADLTEAWLLVKKKGSAGGIDQVTIETFGNDSEKILLSLSAKLAKGEYVPEPYQRIYIPKDENESRRLGLPTVSDKIVQLSAKRVMEPVFEKLFLNHSYGYRQGKGPVKAINRIRDYLGPGHCNWVTLADIDNFFDTINPGILFEKLAPVLQSERLLDLIKLWVKIGSVSFRFKYEEYREGVPQGSIISPLLANFYLNPFDHFMVSRQYGLVRYADDFVILTQNQEKAHAALKDARSFLENELRLKLNKEQVVKKVTNGFEFMHILFTGTKTSLSAERMDKLIVKIEQGIQVRDNKPDGLLLEQTLRGIRNYYARLIPEEQLETLDQNLCRLIIGKYAKACSSKRIEQKQHISNFLSQLVFLSATYNNSRRKYTDEIYKAIVVAVKPRPPVTPDKQVDKLIERKRAKYEALADAGRELVITSPGVFIGKTQKGITVKDRGVKKLEHPLHNLKHIIIMSAGTTISSNVIFYCAANKIPIDFLGFDGMPFAKLFSPVYPDGNLGLAQQAALTNGKGVELLKSIVAGKMKNQLGLIRYYYKYRKTTDMEYAGDYGHHTSEITKIIDKVGEINDTSVETTRQIFMGYEGHVSAFYWDMMIKHLNEYVVFEKREHQGATDLVNSMLNYGYAILYSRVWEAVIRARLNPHISFLHAPQPGKPTLAFDLIEEFRQQAVDKVVFALISRGEEMKVEKGLLTSDTKTRLTAKILERLNRKEIFRGKTMRLIEIIHLQARDVAAFIENKSKYKPYVAKW